MTTFYIDPVNGTDNYPTVTGLGFYQLAYTSGNGTQPPIDTAFTAPGGGSGVLQNITVTSGTWVGGNAAGIIYCAKTGTFVAAETITFTGGATCTNNEGGDASLASIKTITGCTAAMIAPGDTIRIAKSPDPVSLGINGTWTDGSAQIDLASAVTANIDLCSAVGSGDNQWVAGTSNSVATETTIRKEGAQSIKTTVVTAFTTGVASYAKIASTDFSTYQQISFWIYSNTAVVANSLRIDLCSDTAGATPVDSFTINYKLEGSRWYPCSFNKGSALGNAIQSVAINVLSDLSASGNVLLYIDNIFAHNGFSLQSLIGKNTAGESWWTIKSINDTAIILGESQQQTANVTVYANGNHDDGVEVTTAYYRNTILTTLATATGTIIQSPQDSGTLGNQITYSGGWNLINNSQDGETWFDGLFGWGYGIDNNSKLYISLEKLGFTRYLQGNMIGSSGSAINWAYSYCYASGCNTFGFGGSTSASSTSFDNCISVQNSFNYYIPNNGYVTNCKSLSAINYGIYWTGIIRVVNSILDRNGVSDIGVVFTHTVEIDLYNCKMNSTTAFTGHTILAVYGTKASSMKHNQTVGAYRCWMAYANGSTNVWAILNDTVLYKTASPSMRLTPNHASIKAVSAKYNDSVKVCVNSGATITVSVYVRQSSAYNGSKPRLIVRQNVAAGISADTVLDTATNSVPANDTGPGSDDFELLTGTTAAVTDDAVLEFIIDCDGTVGWINIDDWSVV